jgi:hypothetical protein
MEPKPPSIISANSGSRPAAVSGWGGVRKLTSARMIDQTL